MKGQILEILRDETKMTSGEDLSARLGISRVAVWKHIQKLQALGYRIIGGPRGYQLVESPDVPFGWEFPGREHKFFYYPEVASTMDVAKELARKGCADFTVVVADRQKNGRGRLQRVWRSADGGLYFTVVVRPQIPILLSTRISFCASLTMARLLQEMFGIAARVKWPNDILVAERKICGMLSEMEAEADQVTFLNIGLGLNVNNDPGPDVPAADSLSRILGRRVSRKEILAGFLDKFEARMKKADFEQVISEWKRYSITLSRFVKIVTHREVSAGMAVDVDESGALVLKTADGSLKRIVYGDCFHQDSQP